MVLRSDIFEMIQKRVSKLKIAVNNYEFYCLWMMVQRRMDDYGMTFDTAFTEACEDRLQIVLAGELHPYIKGDYVLQPILNSFNDKISYWISKRGMTVSVYCFSAKAGENITSHIDAMDAYIHLFQNKAERLVDQQ